MAVGSTSTVGRSNGNNKVAIAGRGGAGGLALLVAKGGDAVIGCGVPVVRPLASRNVTVPLLLVVAVPVV
jgi:hypothetical protein